MPLLFDIPLSFVCLLAMCGATTDPLFDPRPWPPEGEEARLHWQTSRYEAVERKAPSQVFTFTVTFTFTFTALGWAGADTCASTMTLLLLSPNPRAQVVYNFYRQFIQSHSELLANRATLGFSKWPRRREENSTCVDGRSKNRACSMENIQIYLNAKKVQVLRIHREGWRRNLTAQYLKA